MGWPMLQPMAAAAQVVTIAPETARLVLVLRRSVELHV